MTRQRLSLGFVALLVCFLAGCSNAEGPAAPTSTFTLTGTVTEMTETGPVPVAGAQVSETRSGRTGSTDASGSYTIAGVPKTSEPLSVTIQKDGFFARTVTVNGNPQLSIRLERMFPGTYFTLSGVVFETTAEGRVPVEGATLYCDSCGSPVGHTFVDTDAEGFYKFEWSSNGVHPIFVWKTGYGIRDPKLLDTSGRIGATVRGDTRFDIEMERR